MSILINFLVIITYYFRHYQIFNKNRAIIKAVMTAHGVTTSIRHHLTNTNTNLSLPPMETCLPHEATPVLCSKANCLPG
jgi:hypothetical protein